MIPSPLQQLVDVSLEAVRQHPYHALLPLKRREIYDQLGPLSDTKGRRRRGWLAILTAQYVLPLCQQAQASALRAERWLTLAKDVFHGNANADDAAEEAERAWDWLTNDYGDRQEVIPDSALSALTAVVEALFTVLGEERFEGVLIKVQDTDADLDPWSSDTALWAANAVAGPVWEPQSDNHKRLEFWTWWLTEAVPAAWQEA